MNILDVLRQISNYCESHKLFRVGIYVRDYSRGSTIRHHLQDIVEGNDLVCKTKIIKTNNIFEVRYIESGSTIQVTTASESARGRKYNLILAESQINLRLKHAVIWPSLFPEMQETSDGRSSTALHHPIEYLEFELM